MKLMNIMKADEKPSKMMQNIRHEESPTLHTFRRSFFKLTYITSSYLKKRGGWGGRSPPHLQTIGEIDIDGCGEGLSIRHDTLFMFRESKRWWAATAPLVCKPMKLRDVTIDEVDSLYQT